MDDRPQSYIDAELKFTGKMKRQFYGRPAASWWPVPDAAGLKSYGHVPMDRLDSPYTLILPNGKGSIDVREQGLRQNLPAALSASARPAGTRKGKGSYYIAQLTPAAVAGKDSLQIRASLKALGLEPIDYVPNNAFLVRVSDAAGAAALADRSKFQFSSELSRSDKIDSRVGRGALRDPDRAASDDFYIVIRVMPGEDVDQVVESVRHAGGEIRQVHRDVAGEDFVSAIVRNNRLLEVADDPGVLSIWEESGYAEMNLVTSAQVEMGRFLDPRDFGDFILPLRAAGIDGGGIISTGLPNYKDPNPGAALSLAGAVYAVQPQFLGLADNGLTLDSPAFSNDNTHPCLTGACVA
ncbi:MAG TPA: hypothetical protein VFE84_11910, partial [Patescibacteria group bacterium]|nr:hypothetical protein [Patescibacteria group bacterium]